MRFEELVLSMRAVVHVVEQPDWLKLGLEVGREAHIMMEGVAYLASWR